MRAITVEEYGAIPTLSEVPDPHAGPGEVLINVQVAGINPMDRAVANGAIRATVPSQFPLVLGSDLVGMVEAVGEGAARFSPREEVFGKLPPGLYGTYADYVAVSEDVPLAPLPKGLDRTVAAALPTPGVTALQIVQSLGPLAGKTTLIVGAAGGVGSFVTQLAAQAGAEVLAIDCAEAAERLRAYGAVETFDTASASVPAEVRRMHPDGIDGLVDVASDAAGFATLAELVNPGGVALTTRSVAEVETLASRRVSGVNFNVQATAEAVEQIGKLVADGSVVAPPITVITLEEVMKPADAPPVKGKTVITL